MDKQFLQGLGYTVLERPYAMDKVSEDTFLFAPHLDFRIIAVALTIAHPSLYMGSTLEFCIETESVISLPYVEPRSILRLLQHIHVHIQTQRNANRTLIFGDLFSSGRSRDGDTTAMGIIAIFESYLATHSSRCMPAFEGDGWWRYINICWTPSTGSAVEPLVDMDRFSAFLRTLPPH